MNRLIVLLASLWIATSFSLLSAQNAVTVYYQLDGLQAPDTLLQELFSSVNQQLQPFQLQADFQPFSEGTPAGIWLTVRPAQSDHPEILLHLDSSFLRQRSSLLLDSVLNRLDWIDPDYRAIFAAALILYHNGNHTQARLLLNDFHAQYPAGPAAFYLGNIAVLADDLPLAADYYAAYLWDSVSLRFVGHNLAWVYAQLGHADKALILLNRLILLARLFPASCETIGLLTLRADIQALAFDYTNAMLDYEQAVTLIMQHPCADYPPAMLYTGQARVVFLTYEWDRVLSLLNTALTYDPHYAPALFERGILHYTMAQREQALADFRMVLQLAPRSAQAALSETYIESIQAELQALGRS